MKGLVLLLALLVGYVQAQQAKPLQQAVISDPNMVLDLLRGEVTMIGSAFPNITFQTGVLYRLKSHRIGRLTLLTTREQLGNMRPLRDAGAAIYYLPIDHVQMTGNTLFVGNNTIIFQTDPARWTVIQGNQLAAQAKASLNLYFNNARRY